MDLYRFPTFETMTFYVDKLRDVLPYFDGLSIAEAAYKGSILKQENLNHTQI